MCYSSMFHHFIMIHISYKLLAIKGQLKQQIYYYKGMVAYIQLPQIWFTCSDNEILLFH